MKNVVFRSIAITLVLLIVFNAGSSFAVYAIEDNLAGSDDVILTTASNIDPITKLHFYLDNQDNSTIDDINELNQVTNSLLENYRNNSSNPLTKNSSPTNSMQMTIQFQSNYLDTREYKNFLSERKNLDEIEDIRQFKKEANAFSKEYHSELIAKQIQTLPSLDSLDYQPIPYSPFAVFDIDDTMLDTNVLLDLASSSQIAHISIAADSVYESEATWTNTLKEINAYDIVTNDTYTGNGVRVGILESGVCNPTIAGLSDKNITLHSSTDPNTSHANAVTRIISTMAPDAEFFCASYTAFDTPGIAWFIDQACDVVNCSFGVWRIVSNNDGTYSEGIFEYRYDIDAVYDYQILTSFTTVVVSAGNVHTDNTKSDYNPNGKITSPGYAYNAITVGGVKRTLFGNLEYEEDACYYSTEPEIKPNISALFTVTVPYSGIWSGTSFAAPQVTGSIALLLEAKSSLTAYPERIMSLITSTAQKSNDYSEDAEYFDSHIGAGVIDLQKMIDHISTNHNIWHNPQNSSFVTPVYSVDLDLDSGTEIQVAIAWMATATNTSANGISISEITCPDYDLKIVDEYGNVVTSSLLLDSNVELLRYTTSSSGKYQIRIYHYSSNSNIEDVYISLTYNY